MQNQNARVRDVSAPLQVPDTEAWETRAFIGGRWHESSDRRRFPVVNPATEEVITQVEDCTVDDALAALDAAAGAAKAWAATAPRHRADVLRRCYDLMIARETDLARLVTLENGKALRDSVSEIRYAAEFFRWYSEEAVRNLGQVSIAPSSGARILVQHRPAGIAVLVTPWNYPAAMATRKIAPALAAGCTVVLKPAPETPLTALVLAQVMHEAGVPAGVVNVVTTERAPEVVAALLDDRRTRVVSFTGSTEVGKILLREAARNVINPRMELRGNAPLIVFDDADLDAAVEGALLAKMRNLGEACTAANRFYVQSGIHDAFAHALAERMAALKVGNGLQEGTEIGALVNAETRDKVAAFVDDAVARGAKILTGGRRPEGAGYFYPPTVLADVPDEAACMNGEIFGPVAALRRFTSEDEVVTLGNETEYGLMAYVFTRDLKRGLQVSERLEFGMIGLNRGLASDPAAPFGGMKQSGLGREGAHEGMQEFLETQYIATEW